MLNKCRLQLPLESSYCFPSSLSLNIFFWFPNKTKTMCHHLATWFNVTLYMPFYKSQWENYQSGLLGIDSILSLNKGTRQSQSVSPLCDKSLASWETPVTEYKWAASHCRRLNNPHMGLASYHIRKAPISLTLASHCSGNGTATVVTVRLRGACFKVCTPAC